MINKKFLITACFIAPTISYAQLNMGCPFNLSALAELQSPNNDTVVFGVAKNDWTINHLNEYHQKGVKCISGLNMPDTIKKSQISAVEKDIPRFKEVIERNAYQKNISDRRRESERLINNENLDFVKMDREGYINSFQYKGISRNCNNINRRIYTIYPDTYEKSKRFEDICLSQQKDTKRNPSLADDYSFTKANVNYLFKTYEDLTKMSTVNPVEIDNQTLKSMQILIGNAKEIRNKYFDYFEHNDNIKNEFSQYDKNLNTIINNHNKRSDENSQILERAKANSEYKSRMEEEKNQCDKFLADKIPEKLKLKNSVVTLEGHLHSVHKFFCDAIAKQGLSFKFSGNSDLTIKNKKDDALKLKYSFFRFPNDLHKNEINIDGYIMGFTHINIGREYLPIKTDEDRRMVGFMLMNLMQSK